MGTERSSGSGAAGFNLDDFLLSHPAAPVEDPEQSDEFRAFIEYLGREFRPRSKDELFLGKKWIFVRSISAVGDPYVTALGTRARHCCLLANLVTEELILVSEKQAVEAYDLYKAVDRRPQRKSKYARHSRLPVIGLYSVLSPSLQPLLKAQANETDPFSRLPRRVDAEAVSFDPFAPATEYEIRMRKIFKERAATQLQRLRKRKELDTSDIVQELKDQKDHILAYERKWAPLMYM